MRGRAPSRDFWRDRNVLVTGHTGFKGSWLTHLLHGLGARIHGFSIGLPTIPCHFGVSGTAQLLTTDARGDINDASSVRDAVRRSNPSVILHLAAQPIVIEGYRDPVGTFGTNVMGTLNVLEAARQAVGVEAVIVVTTDKVYRNRATTAPYLENDPLGGDDPYSASKAASEMVAKAYRHLPTEARPRIVTVRAGNVIGGGDWSPWRLLPDLFAAMEADQPLLLRNPHATRPWQHVLDPLTGYLILAQSIASNSDPSFPTAWNFGPDAASVRTVLEVISRLETVTRRTIQVDPVVEPGPKEHQLLALDSARARELLAWRPRWGFDEAVDRTAAWHAAFVGGRDMRSFTHSQIAAYEDGLNQE